MDRIGLVLEGGGMRGAYTAGALKWLNDHHISFDYNVGISSGAVYLICYLLKNEEAAYHMAIDYAGDKDTVGIRALMKEGYYVAYKHLFNDCLKKKDKISMEPLKANDVDMELGCYDLEQGRTVYFKTKELDEDLVLLRAACSLPIVSETVEYEGRKLIDGGLTKMIPIERSIERGCTKHFVITTKPEGYVRKEASGFMKWLMKMWYKDYPQEYNDYAIRHINYNKQMDLIQSLQEEGKAYMVRPSKTIKVSRFSGDPKNLIELYELGYSDMEAQKDAIYAFLGKKR